MSNKDYSNLLAENNKRIDLFASWAVHRLMIIIISSADPTRSRGLNAMSSHRGGKAPAAIDRAQQSTDAAAAAHHSPTRRDLDSTTAHSPRPCPTHGPQEEDDDPRACTARTMSSPLLRSIHSHPSARPCPSGQMPGRASQIHSITNASPPACLTPPPFPSSSPSRRRRGHHHHD